MKQFLVFLCLLFCTATVFAHGGGEPRLLNEPLDDKFYLSAWTNPRPLTISENAHVSIALADIETQEPILNRTITVQWRDLSERHQPVLQEAELGRGANTLYYEADVLLPDDSLGEWEVSVFVVGVDDIPLFTAEVKNPRPKWLWSIPVVALVIGGGIIWKVGEKR